ncbi:MAG TPA: HlyD family secretion protein [Gammaproteobacteria bacterium]|nr:HlyD family secretion protein [Gammaproteobacteria bacterium]
MSEPSGAVSARPAETPVNAPALGPSAASSLATKLGTRWKALAAVGGALVLAAAGALYILAPKSAESTDNAYTQADSSLVAPKVRGLVAAVLAEHNEFVRAGTPLVRIDSEEFDARVASATAILQNAAAAVGAARAALVSLDAEQGLADANLRAAESSVRAAAAQGNLAGANRRRYDNLVASGAVSRLAADQFGATAVSADAGTDRARAEVDVARNQAAVTHAKRAILAANVQQAEAAVASASAALELARQDQEHTTIRAPIDGVVGDRQVAVGDYVQPGTRLLTIVPASLYVVANFKETQTARMRAGQPAAVELDALPGVTLTGRVESFAPGSGSQFALLPFEPGTGNFTKIVQRVPVRIRFDADQASLATLRPGLSATVTVRLADVPAIGRGAAPYPIATTSFAGEAVDR